MARFRTYCAAAAIILGIAAASWAIIALRSAPAPSLQDAIGVSPASWQTQLYSGARDPKTGEPLVVADRSDDKVSSDGSVTSSYQKNKDGSLVITDMRIGTKRRLKTREFYRQVQGERFYRLKLATTYENDKEETLHGELKLRLDGTIEWTGTRLPKGTYEIANFYNDGTTMASRVLIAEVVAINPHQINIADPDQRPFVYEEDRWSSPETGHVLVFKDVRNKEDASRLVLEYGLDGKLLKQTNVAKGAAISGSTVVAFFPGTDKKRLDAECGDYDTKVKFYRIDGTLERTESLAGSSVDISYYSQDGQRELFRQHWMPDTTTTNGVKTIRYLLNYVYEMTADGKDKKRLLLFQPASGLLMDESAFNVTINGLKYKNVVTQFRTKGSDAEIGTAFHIARTPDTTVADPHDEGEDHAAAENIRTTVPAFELVQPDLSDNLPVPAEYEGYM